MKKHLLFVCSSNVDRGPTAVGLFEGNQRFEAQSCGIEEDAIPRVEDYMLRGADIILCMEDEHKLYIENNFPKINKNNKEIIVLDIPDDYMKNDPELIRLLKEKLQERWLL